MLVTSNYWSMMELKAAGYLAGSLVSDNVIYVEAKVYPGELF